MSTEAARTPTWPLRITCVETAGIARRAEPVTLGLPLPQGLLAEPGGVALRDQNGADLPLQAEALSHWPDGSVRWLLLDFAADMEGAGRAEYSLSAALPSATGNGHGNAGGAGLHGVELQVALEAGDGNRFVGLIAGRSLRLETTGPLRTSAHADVEFAPALPDVSVALRSHVYGGSRDVRLELTVTNHRAEPLRVESLMLSVALPGDALRVWFTGPEGNLGVAVGQEAAALEVVQTGPTAWGESQPFALRWRSGEATESATDRQLDAAWCAAETDRVRGTLAVRRFAALHPKGISVVAHEGTARLGAAMVPAGCGGLTLLPGVAASIECSLRVEPPAVRADPATVTECFARPLHAFADPAWVCATGAMGDLVPADDARFPRYEWLTRGGLDALAAVRERRHEYGQLDFGDWAYDRYPRGWGNVEYDLPHALFMLYARSGEARFLEWALDSVRHFRDVDVNHGGHPGLPASAPHAHYTDHAGRGNDLGHTWLEGLLDHYYLTGDRNSLETARGIADFCIDAAARTEFAKRSERAMGWLLICLTGMYRATLEAKYLDGCAPIVEQALAWQSPEGHWPNPIGECDRTPKCSGGKPFMVGMVLEGMRRYHELTHDTRVGELIVRAARWLATDGVWIARDHGWVYATCHKYLGRGRAGEVRELDGLLYAYRLAGEPRLLEIALDAFDACLRPVGHSYSFDGEALDGKGYATLTRSTPHVLARLAALAPDRRW